jgi:hypothetical protein
VNSPEAVELEREQDRQIARRQEIGRANRERAKERADAAKKAADAEKKVADAEEKARVDSFRPERRRNLAGEDAGAAVERGLASPGPKGATKGNVATDRERADARRDDLARQVMAKDRDYTGGIDFDPNQAKEIADQALALQRKGVDLTTAVVMSMQRQLQGMAQLQSRVDWLMGAVGQMDRAQRQFERKMQPSSPTALKR